MLGFIGNYEICKYFYNSSYLYYCILFLASVDRDYDVKAFKNKYIQYAVYWTVGWSDLALLAIFENGHYVLPIRYIFVSPIPKIA